MSIRLVLLLTVLLHLAFAGSRVTLSLLALHLQATPLTVGILISLLAAVPLLFAVGWGRNIDRIGRGAHAGDRSPTCPSGGRTERPLQAVLRHVPQRPWQGRRAHARQLRLRPRHGRQPPAAHRYGHRPHGDGDGAHARYPGAAGVHRDRTGLSGQRVASDPLRHGLEVGREFRYTVFDGQLLKLAEARQRVEGYETSELFAGPTFKVSTRLHGHTTQTWINRDGKPVLELALNGVLISALEDEQRARRYLALASLNKQEVLLDFSRVAADRPIPAARSRHTLELALGGIDAAHLPPADTVQTCTAGTPDFWKTTSDTCAAVTCDGEPVGYSRQSQTSCPATFIGVVIEVCQ